MYYVINMDTLEVTYLLLVTLLTLIVGLFFQYYKLRWPVTNFPPGPSGWPFIGSVFEVGKDNHFHTASSKYVKKYGNIFSIMLDAPAVVVNGYDAILEVTQMNKGYTFASRRDTWYSEQTYNPKKLGIFMQDFSKEYQHHRNFILSTLRGFGMGKASIEGKIMDEVKCALDDLKNLAKVPQDISKLVTVSVANVLCDTILGQRYDHDDKEFLQVLDVLDEWFKSFSKPNVVLLDLVPASRPFLRQTAKSMITIYDKVSAFTMGKVAEHQKTFKPESEPRDFIDFYLAKMAEEPDIFNLEELEFVLSDLFSASTDTTANTLRFGILYMILNPDIQENVHREIVKVVGTSRLPCLQDRDQMHYTIATIHEIQRLSCIATSIPRCTTTDTKLCGFSIPKGTNIICNIWGLHHDSDLWPDPDTFNPTRHLNDQGEVVKSPYLMPFGAGRRACIGESFAKMELFLFFSSLLQRFKFEIPPGVDTPSTEPDPGFTLSPKPYQVIINEYSILTNSQ